LREKLSPQTLPKKKRHTLKAQVLVNQATEQIICTAFAQGRIHDFRAFKSHRLPMLPEQLCLADRGYQGITKRHLSSCTPTKKLRKRKLDKAEGQHNRCLAQLRVVAEHVNRKLNIFGFWRSAHTHFPSLKPRLGDRSR
jgi:DDE superfamily endonuclease